MAAWSELNGFPARRRHRLEVVDPLFGKRPFRVHIDPTQDGADVAPAAGV
jgi:hypothetical protein